MNKSSTADDLNTTRRRHNRRNCDKCIGFVKGSPCLVHNWSIGGALIESDDRIFSSDEEVDITLKFKLNDRIIDLAHRARVVRKANGRIAMKFVPLTQQVKNGFQKVIDHYVATEFANSQA